MEEIQNDLDSAPDLPASQGPDSTVDSSAALGDASGDSFQQLQERMTGEDSPWYSPSAGHVVTKDGETIYNPKTGQPFKSEAEYQSHLKASESQQPPAKPKTEQAQTPKAQPMQKSFSQYLRGEAKETTPDMLRSMADAGKDYQYQDELLPSLSQQVKVENGQPEVKEDQDPFAVVEENKKVWDSLLISPFEKVKAALLEQGADPVLVDQLLAPIVSENQKIVESEYKRAYQNALKETARAPYEKERQSVEAKQTEAKSMENIKTLASKYYPQVGEDMFFSLINGHYENGNFVRGPAANIMDFAARLANRGKEFASENERNDAIKKTFLTMTANPEEARVLFDLAHNYVIGKEFAKAKNIIYQQAKQDVAKDQRRIQQTIKTPPASFSAPDVSGDEGMPSLIKTVTRQMATRY